eukprot:scaffold66034_cov66-Phaeocystis_antarctica.AAC.7
MKRNPFPFSFSKQSIHSTPNACCVHPGCRKPIQSRSLGGNMNSPAGGCLSEQHQLTWEARTFPESRHT